MKEYALVTGASSGIGQELAKELSHHGFSLIVVARRQDKLEQLKKLLEAKYNVSVQVVVEDLSDPESPGRIMNKLKALEGRVKILVNNAGSGYVGEFLTEDLERERKQLELNVFSLTQLTKLFAAEMKRQGGGYILNVASTGAYHPGPYIATYYAAKAYVLSFSEALAVELAPYNITVSTLCPGATRTEFSKNAGRKDNAMAMSATKVAQIAYRGLMKKKSLIIPGISNRLWVGMPRKWAKGFIANYQRKLKRVN